MRCCCGVLGWAHIEKTVLTGGSTASAMRRKGQRARVWSDRILDLSDRVILVRRDLAGAGRISPPRVPVAVVVVAAVVAVVAIAAVVVAAAVVVVVVVVAVVAVAAAKAEGAIDDGET